MTPAAQNFERQYHLQLQRRVAMRTVKSENGYLADLDVTCITASDRNMRDELELLEARDLLTRRRITDEMFCSLTQLIAWTIHRVVQWYIGGITQRWSLARSQRRLQVSY
ncbi:hypothetical protein Plhal304r1_c012g0047771 [Plasmopara halstedii]